ncbi:unnamed protein product [Eruca vesicaria subsp. sativa]|uniref:Uncharacterized protein n=1 Tax=Eruca vesicaria subsp. sativa TaxID=29727 RepID=A0ABC8IZL6_ERUVS|nr:unnamed protein product [Eruca vesicaria subsp. sativa]
MLYLRSRNRCQVFTLRLPQKIHDQLVNQGSTGHVVLPQVRSSIRGYITGSLRNERNYFYFERFDQDHRFDRRPFFITPPYRPARLGLPVVLSTGEIVIKSVLAHPKLCF